MIDLNQNPEAALTLTVGDSVLVDNREFVVCYCAPFENSIYLTSADSRVAEYNDTQRPCYDYDEDGRYRYGCAPVVYSDYITHVKNADGECAVMTREQLFNLLNTNTYTIV